MKKFIKQHPILSWSLIILFVALNLFFDAGLFSDDNFIGADGAHQISTYLMMLIVFVVVPMAAPVFLSEYEKPAWKRICLLFAPFGTYVGAQTLVFLFFSLISRPFSEKIHPLLVVGMGALELAFVFLHIFLCAVVFFLSKNPRWYIFGFLSVNFSPCLIAFGILQICRVNPLWKNTSIKPASYNPLLFFLSKDIAVMIVSLFVTVTVCILVIWAYKKYSHKINFAPLYAVYEAYVLLLISLSVGFLPLLVIYDITETYVFIYAALTFVTLVVLMLAVYKKYKATLITVGVTLLGVTLAAGIAFLPHLFRDKKTTLPKADEIASVKITLDSLETCVITSDFDECLELHKSIIEILEKDFEAGEDDNPAYTTNVWEDVIFWYTLKNGKTFIREYCDLKDIAFDSIFIDYLQSDMYQASLKNTNVRSEPVMRYSKADGYEEQCIIDEYEVEDIISTYCDELKSAEYTDFYESYDTLMLDRVYELNRNIYIPVTFAKTRDKIEQIMFMNSNP